MTFYILPENLNDVTKKLDNMMKHLTKKPIITISEPKPVETTMHMVDRDSKSVNRYRSFVNLIEISVEHVMVNDWLFVATIDHKYKIVTKLSNEYFTMIPSKYGIDYIKCDHCGKSHSHRTESHIVYNPTTNEWMQVGTACVNKMFNEGKYISKFAYELNKIIDLCGCADDSESLGSWFRAMPDKRFNISINIDNIIPVVNEYFKSNPKWIKTYWDGDVKFPGSTSAIVNLWWNNQDMEINHDFNNEIKNFVKNLGNDTEFITNLKAEFESGYINMYNVHYVYYAIKMYNDFLNAPDFIKAIADYNITVYEKFAISGKLIDKKEYVNIDQYSFNYMETVTEYYIKDDRTGLTFVTKANINKYEIADKTYAFAGNVSCISKGKQLVYFRGRLSKVK